jgi:hypothetical protein
MTSRKKTSLAVDAATTEHIRGRYLIVIALIGLVGTVMGVIVPLCCRSKKPNVGEENVAAQSAPKPTIADEAPMPPGGYPSIDEITDLPDKSRVEAPSVVLATKVVFRYRNATGIPMKLVLFDCYYHYFPLRDEPLAPQSPWRAWDFPATGKFLTYSEFTRGTGWYVFFVQRLDTGARYQLGTENIFNVDRPTLTVEATSDVRQPFKAVFGTGEGDAPK